MSFKVAFCLFLCGFYLCSANPVRAPQPFTTGDDESNWEAVLNEANDNPIVSRSVDNNVFDQIARINAKSKGRGIGRNDSDRFLFEGDIRMNKSDAINMIENNGKSRQTRGAIAYKDRLWQKDRVAYVIDSSLDDSKAMIKRAINDFEEVLTCLGPWQDFTERTNTPTDFMFFTRSVGCSSDVGRAGGPQQISIGKGCEHREVVVHEIGHAVGLWHEQSRLDRDNYITILWDNIDDPENKFNFEKHTSEQLDSLGVEYDYNSIMHYGRFAFSNGLPTIESKPPGITFGTAKELSPLDKKQLRLLYGCTSEGCQVNLQPDDYCKSWQEYGYCQTTYVEYMNINCCKTCNEGFLANCIDKDTRGHCPTWKQYGYCGSRSEYYRYMNENCAKTCGAC